MIKSFIVWRLELTSGQFFFFVLLEIKHAQTLTVEQSVKCALICSLQIIVGYSMRNLTSGEIRTDVCQSPSWHPSHGGAAITEEEAVCRDAWGVTRWMSLTALPLP